METIRRHIRQGIFATLLLFFVPTAQAVDELLLSGVLQSTDSRSGTAVVDVKSQNCRGMRRFKVDNASRLANSQGKVISFFIDSSVCKDNTIYRIMKVEREGRKR